MGDIESTVDSALQCTEDLRASGGTGKTDVEVASKGAFLTFDWFVFEFTAGDVRGTLVHGIELVLLECSSSQEETGAVGSSIVRQTKFHTVTRQFVSVRRSHNVIAFNARVGDLGEQVVDVSARIVCSRSTYLTDDVFVGHTDDESVFGRVVLILVLVDEGMSSIEVGFSLWKRKENEDRKATGGCLRRRRLDLTWYLLKYALFLTTLTKA